MYDPPTLSCHIYLRQLLFVELIQRQLDRTDGVEQVTVAPQGASGQRWQVFRFSQQGGYEQTASAPGGSPSRNNSLGSWK